MSQQLWLILLLWSWMMLIKRWTTRYHPTQVQLEILVCTAKVCHNYNAIFLGINFYIIRQQYNGATRPADSTCNLCCLLSSEFPDSDLVSYSVVLLNFLDLMHCLYLHVFALILPCVYTYICLSTFQCTATQASPIVIPML